MIDPQIDILEKVAEILEKVPEKFIFTGGATIVLYKVGYSPLTRFRRLFRKNQ
ncbi:hypothetical protein Xen7305DRAFT_00033100 [Xenococcus sp. PCC 7305]|uniref:hypothetical protein n=1 Tax=Xenococcus sp. PCC 7305 TaxID=102125 RepID=UPI0002ACCC96|nr:hypothetical protein [Xenococcus sp. PCC 7305]ELS03586.1 hypothetical protein Xen7305DRAFT_00033100 [Xenococcus sp. PCC 7305]